MNKNKAGYIISTIASILWISIALTGCGNETKAPDVKNIEVTLNTQRLDKDLYELDTNHMADGLQKLGMKYPEFLNFYLDTLMGFGVRGNFTDTNVAIRQGLRIFLTHKDYRGVFVSVMVHYPDTKAVEEDLAKGFQYMKNYFPSFKTPRIIYLVTGLNNYGALTYGDTNNLTIGIGLDMFLGGKYPFYKAVGMPDYFAQQLTPEYIPVAVMRTLYRDDHRFEIQDKVLLDMMIQSGKEMYFITSPPSKHPGSSTWLQA